MLELLKESILETLWPSRCAVCDAPGQLICENCIFDLDFIDQWAACPRCGAPFSFFECCDCNLYALQQNGYKQLSFDSCTSAVLMGKNTGRIIVVYKDQGDRKLAFFIARIMYGAFNPAILARVDVCSFVPASNKAYKRRGFDHMELIARFFSNGTGLPLQPFFQRPKVFDQRKLGRTERFKNLQYSLQVIHRQCIPKKILLLDDTFTTGATLFAAASTLKDAGAKEVHCLTFARVM